MGLNDPPIRYHGQLIISLEGFSSNMVAGMLIIIGGYKDYLRIRDQTQ